MKTKLIALLLFATNAFAASVADVALVWDANPPGQQVSGYYLYEQLNNQNVPMGFSPTNGYTRVGVSPGLHTYVVTATNMWGESAISAPASTPGAATSPVNIRITITVTVP